MKKIIALTSILFWSSLFCFVAVFAQTETDQFPVTTPEILDYYNAVLSGLVFLWGTVAKAFKLNTKVDNFVFVVIAGAVTISGVFIALGFADGIQAAFTVLTTMGLFDLWKGISKEAVSKKDE